MSELAPIEQKEVDFYGDGVTAVRLADGQVYGSLRHMCNALGLDTVSQRRHRERHDLLNEGKGIVKVTTPRGIGEVYRRYNITGYKQLPLAKFDDCLGWLNEGRESLEGGVV